MTPFPKTVKAARALPLVEDEFFKVTIETLPSGEAIRRLEARGFHCVGIEGDHIIFFAEPDGRLMKVIGTQDGAAKTPFRV